MVYYRRPSPADKARDPQWPERPVGHTLPGQTVEAQLKVPLLDLKAQYEALQEEIDAALKRTCRHSWFRLGPEVEQFERRWADYCDAEHCVGLNSGTSALHLALVALGVGEGDEVITSPMSFFATAEAILYTGARPVFVDIDPGTFCLDPIRAREAVTARTRAIMPVHLFGHPADLDPLLEVAEERNLAVIEDAAQAHGALYKGRKVGAIGWAGCFSFYPTKNLGAYGEAGAIATNDPELDEQLRLLRNHGQAGGYHHSQVGYNYRMPGFQGAVLNVKLPHLDRWNRRQRQIAETYTEGLADTPLRLPREADYARSAWHLYVVRCPDRDGLKEHLQKTGVWAGIHYPTPLPRLEALRGLGPWEYPLPRADQAAREVLSLPVHPDLSDEQVDYVIRTIREFF